MSKPIQRLNIANLAFIAASALLAFLALKMLLFLDAYGSPFPHMDDWRFQNNNSFITTIFTLNNENFQVFTNALYWLAPRFGFPFWGLRYVSFALFLLMMFTLYRLLKKNVPDNRRWLLILAFCPFFSFYMGDNLLWSILSQTWLYFLFTLWAIKYSFEQPQTLKNQIITLIMGIAACFAMNISLPFLFALLYGARTCYLHKEISTKNFYGQLLISILILITCFGLYMVIRKNDTTEFSFLTLLSKDYWLWLSYSLLGVWDGFLISAENTWFYYIGGITILLWLLFLFIRQIRYQETHQNWCTALTLLGGIALIVIFRGQWMLAIAGHTSRHMIYAACLTPIIYTLGATDKNIIIRYIADVLLIAILLCSYPTLNAANYSNRVYQPLGESCLLNHLDIQKNQQDFNCGRGWTDLNKPYQWFVTHDAAFKNAYQKDAATGIYHYNGKVFYKIPGKKILLFR